MDAELRSLYASVVEAVTILQRDPTPLDARAHHALAVLQAALLYLQYNVVEEPPAPDPEEQDTAAQVDDDDSVDLAPLAARSLSEYRDKRHAPVRDRLPSRMGQDEVRHLIGRVKAIRLVSE
jgi:hypothetical protein